MFSSSSLYTAASSGESSPLISTISASRCTSALSSAMAFSGCPTSEASPLSSGSFETTSSRSCSLSNLFSVSSSISFSTISSSFFDILPNSPNPFFFCCGSSCPSLRASFFCSFLSFDLSHICLNFMVLVTGASSSTMIIIFASSGCIL